MFDLICGYMYLLTYFDPSLLGRIQVSHLALHLYPNLWCFKLIIYITISTSMSVHPSVCPSVRLFACFIFLHSYFQVPNQACTFDIIILHRY